MPNPRLMAVITALTMLAAGNANANVRLDDLLELERLVMARDCGALRGFLAVNPAFLEGNDALARELRSFTSDVDSGLISCLGAPSAPAVLSTRAADLSSSLTSQY